MAVIFFIKLMVLRVFDQSEDELNLNRISIGCIIKWCKIIEIADDGNGREIQTVI